MRKKLSKRLHIKCAQQNYSTARRNAPQNERLRPYILHVDHLLNRV